MRTPLLSLLSIETKPPELAHAFHSVSPRDLLPSETKLKSRLIRTLFHHFKWCRQENMNYPGPFEGMNACILEHCHIHLIRSKHTQMVYSDGHSHQCFRSPEVYNLSSVP
jgi:hypothetical protein